MFEEGGVILEGLKKVDGALDSSDGYMVGGKLSLADLILFVVVNQFRAGFMDGVPLDGWIEKVST
jgi:hypothetical protein